MTWKAMEVTEQPTDQNRDTGGLDKLTQELIEAYVLPTTHKECFDNPGIMPPACSCTARTRIGKTMTHIPARAKSIVKLLDKLCGYVCVCVGVCECVCIQPCPRHAGVVQG